MASANNYRITIQRNSANIRKMLRSQELGDEIKKRVGDKIANEVEAKTTANGNDYEYKAEVERRADRAIVRVGTKSTRARYTEAKHGWLQAAAMKRRGNG